MTFLTYCFCYFLVAWLFFEILSFGARMAFQYDEKERETPAAKKVETIQTCFYLSMLWPLTIPLLVFFLVKEAIKRK